MKYLFTLICIALLGMAVPVTANTYTSITAVQADTLIKNHQVGVDLIILDVRSAADFISERIDKAKNIDYWGSGFNDSLAKLDKNKIYLVYCASGSRSNSTMNKMRDLNFKKVFNLLGGLPAWKSAGLPTVRGVSGTDPETIVPITVKLYPNPVTNESILEIIGDYKGEATVEILNSIGSTVQSQKLKNDHFIQIKGRELSAGFYFYRVILPGKVVKSGKFQVTG